MRFLLVFLLIFWSHIALAQDAEAPGAESGSLLSEIEKLIDEESGAALADLPTIYVPSPEALREIDTYTKAYYANLTSGLQFRDKVFAWQHRSSQIIFVVVILIVAVGLYFSWIQFHAKEGDVGETTMEASKTGFKLSSPVLGVIILVLSLAFFYLYLVHVYPINGAG